MLDTKRRASFPCDACISTLIRSRGAVTVRLTAPAIPPAKKIRRERVFFDHINDVFTTSLSLFVTPSRWTSLAFLLCYTLHHFSSLFALLSTVSASSTQGHTHCPWIQIGGPHNHNSTDSTPHPVSLSSHQQTNETQCKRVAPPAFMVLCQNREFFSGVMKRSFCVVVSFSGT